MNRLRIPLLCLLLFSFTGNSQQVPNSLDIVGSGNGFLQNCEAAEASAVTKALCHGYVMGIYDGIKMSGGAGADLICGPEHATPGQLYRVAVKYMQDHPEKTDKFSPVLMFEAWAAGFPCPAKK